MEHMIDAALSVLLPLLVTVLTTIAIPAAMEWLRASKVIKTEAQARILQSALANAAEAAIAKATGLSSIPKGPAVDYVKKSVPETLAKLKLDDRAIADLVEPHIARAKAARSSGVSLGNRPTR